MTKKLFDQFKLETKIVKALASSLDENLAPSSPANISVESSANIF